MSARQDVAHLDHADTQRWELCVVAERYENDYHGVLVDLAIAFDNGSQESITATAGHPFWVIRGKELAARPLALEHAASDALKAGPDGRWVEAKHLTLGDQLKLREGGSATVVGYTVRTERLRVYNLNVLRLHNYAVGNVGVLVHNSCGPGGGRGKNHLEPSTKDASGPHSTFRRDADGNVSHHAEWTPNPRNPSGFDEVKRVDTQYANPHAHRGIPTPHVHDKQAPGGIRGAEQCELPR